MQDKYYKFVLLIICILLSLCSSSYFYDILVFGFKDSLVYICTMNIFGSVEFWVMFVVDS